MSGAANRSRGARAEVAVVNWMRVNGYPDARRYLAGDGRQPGDIDAIPGVCIEVKDRAGSAWPTWLRQAAAEGGPKRISCVVRRTRGVPDVGRWEARWHEPPHLWLNDVHGHLAHTVGTFADFIHSLKETPTR